MRIASSRFSAPMPVICAVVIGWSKLHADEALRREVVDLVRLDFLQQGNAGAEVGQVVLDQVQVRVVLDAKSLRCARN